MKQPKLRDSHNLAGEPYSLGRMSAEMITAIGAGIVYRIHTGRKDISGDDWGEILADVVGGEHLAKPLGLSDVITASTAWSAKTVKAGKPFTQTSVRLISGRNSPDFSYGIEDPHDDVQKTGEAVLGIWNGRVDIAQAHHPRVRVIVLIRNHDCTEFVVYEEYLQHYRIGDYEWRENAQNNFEGFDRHTGEKRFVWQPHGSQFTILANVPDDAVKFRVRRPPVMTKESALQAIGFNSSWVEIL